MRLSGKTHLVLLALLCMAFSVNAQETDMLNKERKKLSGKEARELRHQKEQEYLEWERTYFNSPGKWFINFKAGYGWPLSVIKGEAIAPFEFLGKSYYDEDANGNISDKLNLDSDGQGQRIALGFGMMINRFIGFELELGYVNEVRKTRAYINSPTLQTEFESDLFELYTDPLLVWQTPNMNNWYMYGRIGPHIAQWGRPRAFGTVVDYEGALISGILWDPLQDALETIIGAEPVQDVLQALDYKGTLTADSKIFLQQNPEDYPFNEILRGVGINASLGFKYQATPLVSVFAEARVMGFNVSVAQAIIEDLDAEITLLGGTVSLLELTENGGQILGQQVQPEEIKFLLDILYVNEFDEDANNPVYNPDGFNNYNQREELAPRLSVMSVGFQVGLQINFSGKDITYRTKK